MLGGVAASSTTRLREVRSLLNVIAKMSSAPHNFPSTDTTIAKGLFFVHLYGAYEYTVTSAVQQTLELIGSMGHEVAEYKPMMLSVVLDAKCKAVANVGPKKVWEKRWELFEQIAPGNVVEIDNTVLPTDGGNLKKKQLEMVWTSLCVTAPVLSSPLLRGRLEELVDNRNAIAHGRESPSGVGGRYSVADLEKRYNDVNALCTHMIQSLEDHLNSKDFLA